MKLLLIFIAATFSASTIYAQSANIFKNKPWEEYKLKKRLEDTLSKINAVPQLRSKPIPDYRYSGPQQTKNGVYHVPLKGVYIGENGRGDEIYAMEPDHMPCLVPGKKFASNMPVAGVDKADKGLLPLLEKGDKKIPEVKLIP